MKEYTVRVYDATDIELLEEMSKEDVVSALDGIKRGWLPQNYIVTPTPGKTYTEDEYDATRWHAAMKLAIKMIESNQNVTEEIVTKNPVDVKIEKKKRAAGVDGWGKSEYENYYVVKVNSKKVYQSNDNPTKMIEAIMNA